MTTRDDDARREVHRRKFNPDDCSPHVEIARAIGEIDGRDPNDIDPLYHSIDGVINEIFF